MKNTINKFQTIDFSLRTFDKGLKSNDLRRSYVAKPTETIIEPQ